MSRRFLRSLVLAFAIGGLLSGAYFFRHKISVDIAEKLGLRADISEIRERQTQPLRTALTERNLTFGAPVYLRIFKEEAELEVFVKTSAGFAHFRTYPICAFSGDLGPKLKEGDRQSPEGFYQVTREALNPRSSYHLSFDLGFPNAYDAAHDRTGSFLMVHGRCLSIGCYAMTDPGIEEIYILVEAALENGQDAVQVHAFPFRMEDAKLSYYSDHPWISFWNELAPAYRHFEATAELPRISVQSASYVID